MTKNTFSKIAKGRGLTFYEGIQLAALISDVLWTEKFEDRSYINLNTSMRGHQWAAIQRLATKGFVIINNTNDLYLTAQAQDFPNMGPNTFIDGFSSEDILENIMVNTPL